MATPDLPDTTHPDSLLKSIADNCEFSDVGRLPVIAAFCHKIGISQSINAQVESQADIDPGTTVTAMILDTLSGRTPLYRVHEFLKDKDTGLLLGRPIDAGAFNDDALGRTLDRLHRAGTMKLFTGISLKACELFGVDRSQGHFDTTSVNVWGDYASSTPGGAAPHVTYGHSKDRRPDLKQFMFSLLCVEGNIPLLGKVENGNAPDGKLNNEELQRVARLIADNEVDRENFLYVADCKLVNRANLELLGESPFVTRLPASYKAHDAAVDAALALPPGAWQEVGPLNLTPASTRRPAASYRLAERGIELYGKSYRAIVVHSSKHDKRRQKRIDRQGEKARTEAQKAIRESRRDTYSCERDASAALAKTRARFAGELWEVSGEIRAKNIHSPGRVTEGAERKVRRVDYSLCLEEKENRELAARHRKRAGCFVLLSNAPAPGSEDPGKSKPASGPGKGKGTPRTWDPRQCLVAYKEQYGIENNFSFLKEPLIANDVFLKKTGRIDALGLVLLLSLLVWSLMQRSLRKSVREDGAKLSDLDNQPTHRPTSFIMVHKFLSVLIVKVGGHRRLARALSRDQQQYLRALGLTPSVFTKPPKVHLGLERKQKT